MLYMWLQLILSFQTNQSDEVARLKQEIQRYRLELMNRETNFDRVFSSGSSHMIKSMVSYRVCTLLCLNGMTTFSFLGKQYC